MIKHILFSLYACLLFVIVLAEDEAAKKTGNTHSYIKGDKIDLVVDKIWPRGNPSESYDYYYLPFCGEEEQDRLNQNLGADMTGSRRVKTKYDLPFDTQVEKFKKAVENKFKALMYYDDVPIIVPIGSVVDDRVFLNTQLNFIFTFNEDNVVEVSIVPDQEKRTELTNPKSVEQITFTYSAYWSETEKTFSNRMSRFQELYSFNQELEIQWFSIVNSLVLVVVLTSFLAFIILRILKRDYQLYEEDLDDDDKEETGWKLVHTDVFRFPSNINLLAAILGNGVHLLGLIFCILSLAILGLYYSDYSYNAMYTSLIIAYTLTTGISGYISGSYYKQFGGERWVNNVLLTVILFALPTFIIWAILNTIALSYQSSAAFQFKTIAGILALYFLVSFPLQLIGAITAKNFGKSFDAPCRTKKVPREIPPSVWYKGGAVQVLVAGFLPFSAIYIELYYVFVSIWGHYTYAPFPIVFLVFVILIMVTSCINIAMVYLMLSQEDHKWWWRSILCGGASSWFIYAYSFSYYLDTQMNGLLQTAFFFGYVLIACYGFFLMMATVGFLSSLSFVKRIYKVIKCD
ncbi:phagocytic receptor MP70 [Acrasis kona]|uniref:Transmembrane 9 superfamily member n=1 Tax=Acrasis kona TaxID=1008807 RepID=A0AAW2Z1P4_9EUKA